MPDNIFGTMVRIVVAADNPEDAVRLFADLADGPATLVCYDGRRVPLAYVNIESLEARDFTDASEGNDALPADNTDSVKSAEDGDTARCRHCGTDICYDGTIARWVHANRSDVIECWDDDDYSSVAEPNLALADEENPAKPDLWNILDDVRSSYRLALEAVGMTSVNIDGVDATVQDYLVNHYGDD